MIRKLLRSPALRVAAAFGVAGVAFTVANLIFARVMSAADYGLLSLFMAIVVVSGPAAPLGLDLVITRRGLRLDWNLRRATLAASTLTALVTVAISLALYDLSLPLLVCVALATIAGGATQTSSAHFQSARRFALAVPIMQAQNWVLVSVALLTALLSVTGTTPPAVMIAAGSVLTACVGWVLVTRDKTPGGEPATVAKLWGEAISLVTIGTASAVFLQIERLVVPLAIGVQELATFGVLASLVGSPFRMIQAAVMFTLVPRLRDAKTAGDRRRLLQHEFLLVTSVVLVLSLVMWPVVPYLAHVLLAGRYDLTPALVGATLISGLLKVLSAFSTATATALAPEKGLRWLSMASWASIGIAVVGAMVAAPWGLTGVIYGTCIGWVARFVMATWISLPHLRTRPDAAAFG